MKTWSERDLQDLREGVQYFSNIELGIIFDCSAKRIADKVYNLGLSRVKRRKYSKADETLLETSIGIRPLVDVAKELGRTPTAIYCKVFNMALNVPIHKEAA